MRQLIADCSFRVYVRKAEQRTACNEYDSLIKEMLSLIVPGIEGVSFPQDNQHED